MPLHRPEPWSLLILVFLIIAVVWIVWKFMNAPA